LGIGFTGGLEVAEGQTNLGAQWATFTDHDRHFHFQYPATWKINTEVVPVAHYRVVFVSLNSAETCTVEDLQTSTNTWKYGSPETAKQLPAGTVYMDIGWWEDPWQPRFGPGVHEMEAADLSGPLEKNKEEAKNKDLIAREIEFSKWGKNWSIWVYLRTPVSDEKRRLMDQVLKSFRFDGVPAGDEMWALSEASKKLPPEADPARYTDEGGSSVYYNATLRDAHDVLVMFTKHLEGQPEKTWSYRVLETGEVRPLGGKVLVVDDSSHYHGAMAVVIPQFEHTPPITTTREPVTSLLQGLPEVQKAANRPIVAVTEYTNWFWYSPDGFISGYAVQNGGYKIFRWSLWSR
jgi:hypothetical protein